MMIFCFRRPPRRLLSSTRLQNTDVVFFRIPLVSQWKVLRPLIDCLADHCRITCLVLNNLSIPFENKRIMVQTDSLLHALVEHMRLLPTETYLICICLMNISFFEEAHYKLMYYCPTPPNLVLENPESLLRTLESIVQTFSPLMLQSTKVSVEGEAVRWATGLIRNLVSEQHTHHHAKLVSQTKIPLCLLTALKDSRQPISKWKADTLEDMALQVLLNLAKWPESCRQLQQLQAQTYLQHIEGKGGIHDMRASWIRCSIESLS